MKLYGILFFYHFKNQHHTLIVHINKMNTVENGNYLIDVIV